jgi:hypothetical protein
VPIDLEIMMIMPVEIRQINILSHNFKIGKQTIIYTKQFKEQEYKTEGYFYLSENLMSNY